jgi:hypothetical protein
MVCFALIEIGWDWDADTCVARPDRNVKQLEALIKTTRDRLAEKRAETRAVIDGRVAAPARPAPVAAAAAKAVEELEKSLQALEAKFLEEKKRVASSMCSSVQVSTFLSFCCGLNATHAILLCCRYRCCIAITSLPGFSVCQSLRSAIWQAQTKWRHLC